MEEEKQAKLKFTAKTKEKQFEEELRFEQKYKKKIQLEKKRKENLKGMASHKAANTKLLKLVITKLNGTSHIDWLRFWNQFEAEIDTV